MQGLSLALDAEKPGLNLGCQTFQKKTGFGGDIKTSQKIRIQDFKLFRKKVF